MDRSLLRPKGLLACQIFTADAPESTHWYVAVDVADALGAVVCQRGSTGAKCAAHFVAGVYVMRAAGCVVNDYADRHFDGHVKRTKHRPLATGRISETGLSCCLLFW